MRLQLQTHLRRLAAVSLLLWLSATFTLAQTTSFTYQGRLTDGGTPANGTYDLQFALWDSNSGGTQIGEPQAVPTVAVSSGIFTVQLDFGANAFPGAPRFLEISTRLSGTASFTTLAPRQQITSTPYAVRSLNASSADTIPANALPAGSSNYIQNTTTLQAGANFKIGGNGTIGGILTVNGSAFVDGDHITAGASSVNGTGIFNGNLLANGNVGIGTSTPTDKLTVQTATSNYGFIHTDGTVTVGSFVGGSTGGGWYGTRSNHPLSFFTANGPARLTIDTAGQVGIGTIAFAVKPGGGFKEIPAALVGGSTWISGDSTPLPPSLGKGIVMGFSGVGYISAHDYGTGAPQTLALQFPAEDSGSTRLLQIKP